jgi:hypothetical protein
MAHEENDENVTSRPQLQGPPEHPESQRIRLVQELAQKRVYVPPEAMITYARPGQD